LYEPRELESQEALANISEGRISMHPLAKFEMVAYLGWLNFKRRTKLETPCCRLVVGEGAAKAHKLLQVHNLRVRTI
jgi:hypothetical protein